MDGFSRLQAPAPTEGTLVNITGGLFHDPMVIKNPVVSAELSLR